MVDIPAQQFNTSTFKPVNSSAMTLMEMMLVLFIMAIFVGIGAFSYQGATEEEILGKPAAELQRMARESVSRAGTYEEQQTILFEKDGFGIRYRGEVGLNKKSNDKQYWLRRVQTPPEMKILLKRWGSKEWLPAAGQRWVTLPGGLCEPVAVRLEWKRSFWEMQFHPLTGGVADETMIIAAP